MVHGDGKPVTAPAGATPISPAMLLTPVQLTAVLPRTANAAAVPSDGPTDDEDDVTVTVAKPETLPLVSRTVLLNEPVDAPAVKRPEPLLMLPPPLTTDQMAPGGIETTTPLASFPDAANCCVAFVTMLAGLGVRVMLASTVGAATTVTEVSEDTPPLVTLIVCENTPVAAPAVKRPVLLLIVPPPFTTDQVGAGAMPTAFPFTS
jgi:hypothetical protein